MTISRSGAPRRAALALIICCFWLSTSLSALAAPADDIQALREQVRLMSEQLKTLQERLDKTEQEQTRIAEKDKAASEDLKDMDARLAKAEMHTATDKLALNLELRTAVNSLHENALTASPELMQAFFTPLNLNPGVGPIGLNGATRQQLAQGLAQLGAQGALRTEDRDSDNDILYTTRLRMGLQAKYDEHLSFAGRLTAYKVWGDSTGVQVYGGSMGDITYDGTSSTRPHDDVVRLERAYFVYRNSVGGLPIMFSAGRRPSTEGPPLELSGNYAEEAGSTHAALVNWEMDGASLGFGLEELLDVPGAYLKFCYGMGFESQWANSRSLTHSPDLDDVHMLGIIATLFEGERDKFEMMYAHAWNVTDGFTGLTVMPFTVTRTGSGDQAVYSFQENSGRFISRLEPTANIGDWDGLSGLYKMHLGDFHLFVNPAWSHTHATHLSEDPFYELMGQGLLSSNGELKDRNGWLFFIGGRYDIPSIGAKIGLEYNYGSKYWLNFTGGEDAIETSKLATRGHVIEPYWIQQILGDNFFIKVGAQFYDYDYTGSGVPLGEPVKIGDATGLDALNGIVDRLSIYYISATARF